MNYNNKHIKCSGKLDFELSDTSQFNGLNAGCMALLKAPHSLRHSHVLFVFYFIQLS